MKVKMLKQTNYEGPKLIDNEYDVDDATAIRWFNAGIAMPVDFEEEAEVGPYDHMKAKDLFVECTNRGLEVEEKKSRAYYLEFIVADDTAKAEAEVAKATE